MIVKPERVAKVRLEEMEARTIIDSIEVSAWEIRTALHTDYEDYQYTSDWQPLSVGEVWGKPAETVFFRTTVTIPSEWTGYRVGLRLVTGGEGLLLVNGQPYHGVDDHRTYILLAAVAEGGSQYELEMEMKVGGYWNWVNEVDVPSGKSYVFDEARLVAIDRAVEEALLDFYTVFQSARVVEHDLVREALFQAIRASLYEVDFRDKERPEWADELTAARQRLWEEVRSIDYGDIPATVFFHGHSHIDVAWKWPLRETMRKCGRTFSTVMALMDEFPHYNFNCSQVPLFLYTKKHFPTLYERIRRRADEGRFEPIGGTWVEHDTNLISGESLVRQCLYGQRFFEQEFGERVRVGWLPDVFGYTWSMPQIYKKSGIDYFMTSKISWNDTNVFPHSTFWWEGIDGSRLFTHFICGTYNAVVTPEETLRLWNKYQSKRENPEFLSSYGYGDGGGGPTREMIETIPRMSSIPGIPKARTGRVHEFFDRIEEHSKDVRVWNGELYFELHRGTSTTQARNKRGNRKSENAYRDAELIATLAMLHGAEYPAALLKEGWETILLNHFHDIIPGSSVGEVYRESLEQYAAVIDTATKLRDEALRAVAADVDTSGDGEPVVVFNSLSFGRSELVALEVDAPRAVTDASGNPVPATFAEGQILFLASDVPSMGYAVYRLHSGQPADASPFTVTDSSVETPFYHAELAPDGTIVRLYDKAHAREVLADQQAANVLQFFEDKPANWEAWDVEPQYADKMWHPTVARPLAVVEHSSVRLVLGCGLSYGQSTFEQRIVFYAHTPRIDFAHDVDWQERKTLVKVAFPVDVRSSRATYEIAYGAIERPTHWNTSWDTARFEVSGHRWADLSETGYGVSVLNDCKYGWDIHGNVMRLSLLRGPENPDPNADVGRHEYVYAVMPHADDWRNGTVQEGASLNTPLVAARTDAHSGGSPSTASFATVSVPNVIVDTVKKAEDSDDVILRLYEAYGARGPVILELGQPVERAVETNLLEDEQGELTVDGQRIELSVTPFEVKTLKVRLAQPGGSVEVLLIGSPNAEFALGSGMSMLKSGGSALDAVEHVVRQVEANPDDHSVGVGGWPNLLGELELDASIMDGRDRSCGAVGGLVGFANPISVARKVMELLPHVFLVGRGAADFAAEVGFQREETLTDTAAQEWARRLVANVPGDRLPHLLQRRRLSEWALLAKDPERTGGTVNVMAVDGHGHVASGVSTSGWAWKYPGRLGDSPVVGAGNYCDDRYGAAACTGHGELAIRGATAHSVVLHLRMGMGLRAAVDAAMEDIPFGGARAERVIHILALTPDGQHTGLSSAERVRHYCYMDDEMDEPARQELRRFAPPRAPE